MAVIFSSEGQVLAEYTKIYLLPGFEDHYQPGTKPLLFPFSGMNFGVVICKDMDYPGLLSQYARDGAGVLLVPAWDFGKDANWHVRPAITRGIEGGFAVVRTAQDELLTVSDHMGRIIAEDRSSRAPNVLLVSNVHPGPGRTFYSIYGNWVAWLCLLFLAGVLALVIYRKWSSNDSST